MREIIQSVWPGGLVELPGFDPPDEGPLVVFAGARKRRSQPGKVHRLQTCATVAEVVRAVIAKGKK